ncbi:MAG: hypothetical protein K2N34_10065 [Lachnospiraceae bacterium]|nr:hypothetical protein [Lachnospiraceae bacterium]
MIEKGDEMMGRRGRRRRFRRCSFDRKWFNKCCCNIKKSFDEVCKLLNS